MNRRKSKLPVHRRSTVVMKETQTQTPTATKVRKRIRKPRYVSLTRLDLKTEEPDEIDDEMDMKLIDLFPIRTTAVAALATPKATEAEDLSVSVSMSRISEYFFTSECDSLTELLNSEETISMSVELKPLCEDRVEREEKLVKAALRSRERDESVEEEKWVSYSEVVEDVSSSVLDCREERRRVMKLKLKLKLDYKDVLEAWDGERSLFVGEVDCGQIVPCFDDDQFFADDSNGAWSVSDQKAKEMRIKDEEFVGNWEEDELRWKMGQMRNASLLRYKEKRRNRLYSKRIRYEVRKLNAEKRPRIKGRFVRRDWM